MRGSRVPSEINFARVAAAAAFLAVAALVVVAIAFNIVLSDANPRTETRQFLDDVVDKKNFLLAVVWLSASVGLLLALFFLGLYQALRRWGEDYMRVALLAGLAGAAFGTLSDIPGTAFAAYIIPAWAGASNEAARSTLLSDSAILWWVSDANFAIVRGALALAALVAGLVMLRLEERVWTALGWIGVISGVAGIFGVFELAEEGFLVARFIQFTLLFVWLLGVGVGLWRLQPREAG